MWKNRFALIILMIFFNLNMMTPAFAAETVGTKPAVALPVSKIANKAPDNKKKIKLNFEDETVTGNYEAPDALLMSSRRLIKYKELFNRRTNFIEETESNKGLFNEHQK